MSSIRISPPPGLTTKPPGTTFWGPCAEPLINGLGSAKISAPPGLPVPPCVAAPPSPETVFQCKQITSMIFASPDPLEQVQLINRLATLTLSLSAELAVSKNALDMELARLANAQAINNELNKNLAVTEKALATTANMLAVQAANAASAHASLVDERAIAAAAIRELVLKNEALESATTMLNAQRANLEAARASLQEKDQKIRQKNLEIYAKNLEIQEEKQWVGEAMNARFAKHHEILSSLIVDSGCGRLSEGSDGAEMGSSVGSETPAIRAQNAELKEALAEKVELLMAEEHRSANLRNLLDQSAIEVSRLKTCLEKATESTGQRLQENAHPAATKLGSRSLKAQIAELKEALVEKTNLLKVEEHCSASLRDLLNQSVIEVGRLKICLGEAVDAAGPPFPEAPQDSQGADTYTKEGNQRHEKPRQEDNRPHGNQENGSGAQVGGRIEDGEADGMLAPTTAQVYGEEHSSIDTDEGESLTDEENGSALSTATTHVHNEEPLILHVSQGALLTTEEDHRLEPAMATLEVSNERPFGMPTDEDNFTLSPPGEGAPHIKEEHEDN
ncbi:hypothetical protein HOY82DRAFT_615462 [Tuber indicum]|nr:hypothetical protein HOY82DRAFT_615462 [Tuber indicum]